MKDRGYNPILLRDATTGVEFPDTLDALQATELAVREVEQQHGFTATNRDFLDRLPVLHRRARYSGRRARLNDCAVGPTGGRVASHSTRSATSAGALTRSLGSNGGGPPTRIRPRRQPRGNRPGNDLVDLHALLPNLPRQHLREHPHPCFRHRIGGSCRAPARAPCPIRC